MGTHSTERVVEGPFRPSDPGETLLEFYRRNGYDYAVPVEADDPGEDVADDDSLTLVRGRPAAGWWSSDMTKLPTRVEIEPHDQQIRIHYDIDVTGQHLTEEDRRFWEREIGAAIEYLHHPNRSPRDLRHEEAKRAEQIRRRMLSYGIWGGVIAFLLILLMNMVPEL